MTNCKRMMTLIGAICVLTAYTPGALSQDKAATTVQVHVVITDAALRNDQELPPLQKDDVKLKQGKNVLEVGQLIPAQGESAAPL